MFDPNFFEAHYFYRRDKHGIPIMTVCRIYRRPAYADGNTRAVDAWAQAIAEAIPVS
jgi:hypothetical protein